MMRDYVGKLLRYSLIGKWSLAPDGTLPRQTTDNTWMVFFGGASVKIIVPQI